MNKKLLKRIISLCFAVLMLISLLPAFTVPVFADNSRTVKIGFFEFGGMFEGAEDGAVKRGYCYEYIKQIIGYTGWNYEFVYGYYSELYEMLKNGEIDILPYTNYNEQRGEEVLFSAKTLADEEYYITVPADSELSSKGVKALDNAVITTLTGADYNDLLLQYVENNCLNAKIDYYSNLDETWNAVNQGDADASVFTSLAYNADGWKCIDTFGAKPTYIAVAKDRTDLLSELDEAMELILVDNPAFAGELYSKYFPDNPMRLSVSQEEQTWISEHPVLHVGGFSNDLTDLYFTDDGQEARGITVDVVNGIIDRLNLGITADFRIYDSIEQMEEALDSGEIDVFYPFYPSQYLADEHNLCISNNVRLANMELVFRKNTSYEQALTRIATPATRLGVYFVEEYYPDSFIIGAGTVQEAVDKVRSGEALGAVAYNEAIHGIQEKYNNLNYAILLDGCGTCFTARPENYILIRLLNRGLNTFTNAEMSALAAKYSSGMKVSTRAYFATHREAVIMLVIICVAFAVLIIIMFKMNRLKKQADEANKSKTAFLFNMSHDIRTPLNAIKGFTTMAKKYSDDQNKVKDYLDKIDISGQQLLTLINQVLEMSRIESGKIVFNDKPVNIQERFESMVTVVSAQAKSKGLDFNCSLENIEHYHVLADEARMEQITLNILGNAIKYTPEGGTIDFILREVPPRKEDCASYLFTVKDTGIGMSPEYVKKVFEPFSRENSSTVSKIQGTGLGMSIVKTLVDLRDGIINVESEQGKGTQVDIILDFPIDNITEDFVPSIKQSRPVSFEGLRVLLVEDNEMNREIARDILEEQGLIVEEAEDGDVAVDKVRECYERGDYYYYDFILMDIQMPNMNGYDATRAIRALPKKDSSRIPIIAMTANAFEEDRKNALAAGMDEHLAKPIVIENLFNTLAKFL